MQAEIVTVTNVDSVWHLVAGMFTDYFDEHPSDCSAGDLWMQCRSGNSFLMVVYDESGIKAASVWRPEKWTDGVVLRCIVLAGDGLSSWFEESQKLAREVAIRCGAKSFVWAGRKGWGKIFPEAEAILVTYRMDVQ